VGLTIAFLGLLLVGAWALGAIGEIVPALAVGEKTCRFNITVSGGLTGYTDKFPALRVGSYLDWGHRQTPQNPNGADYVQMLRVSDATFPTSQADIPSVVPANPGAAWIIGNEPDRLVYQDDVLPEVYADRYYDLATSIRALDPTAQLGFGSIVQPTPIRLRYLDRAWNRLVQLAGSEHAASDLIDIWSLHIFILCEDCGWGADIPPGMTPTPGELLHIEQVCTSWPSANCFPDTHDNAIFNQFVQDFRNWMENKGEGGKALWITEYGSVMPWWWMPPSESARYMTETFDFLLTATDPTIGFPPDGDRLVQRWYWFSLNHDVDNYGGSLYDPDQGGLITEEGTAWLNYGYILNTPTYPADPYPADLKASSAGGTNWDFAVTVANQGDAYYQGGYDLEIFLGDPGAGGIQLGSTQTIGADLDGCGAVYQATVQANVSASTPWDIYVRIIPAVPSNDSDLTNNTVAFTAFRPQTFFDVPPAYWGWKYIETTFAAGITDECSTNPLMYCPTDEVTRAQMAVYLLKAEHGAAYIPPTPSDPPVFSDIDGHWAEAWIEQLYNEGITVGYGDGTFRPDNDVKRSEIAVFLLRAKYGIAYSPPPPSGGVFSDIDGHWGQAWIEEIAAEGIAAGHPDGTYRPEDPVNKAQISVFLIRTYVIPMIEP
jgi:hypothetical protein